MELVEGFAKKVMQLVANCEQRGVTLLVYCKVRNPWEQAKLWRRSRTMTQVNAEAAKLRDWGCYFLMSCLLGVGPQKMGAKVTDALPGFSWHQWGEAVDVVPIDAKGNPRWEDELGFEICAEEARLLHLDSGYYWKFRDPSHIQYRTVKVTGVFSPQEINNEMLVKFGKEKNVFYGKT